MKDYKMSDGEQKFLLKQKEAVERVSDHMRAESTPDATRNMARETPWTPCLIFKK